MDDPDRTARTQSFAQGYDPSLTDRFGVWLSARQISRWVPSFAGKRVGDIGCAFHATFARAILDQAAAVTLVDVALAEDLKRHPKVRAIEGTLPAALAPVPAGSLDVLLAISVIEHLWDPLGALGSLY